MFRLQFSRAVFALSHPRFTLRRITHGASSSSKIELKEIEKFGGQIEYVLEAGAADGVDTKEMLSKFPIKEIFAFEPVHTSYLRLKEKFQSDSRVKLFNIALSDQIGFTNINVSSDIENQFGAGSSSLLTPTLHKNVFPKITFRQEDIQNVQTTTLNSWVAENGITKIDLMWLDLQGLELKVLKCAKRILGETKVIHLEVARRPLYEQVCTYREIHNFLTSFGFDRVVERVGYISGNVLYVRKNLP